MVAAEGCAGFKTCPRGSLRVNGVCKITHYFVDVQILGHWSSGLKRMGIRESEGELEVVDELGCVGVVVDDMAQELAVVPRRGHCAFGDMEVEGDEVVLQCIVDVRKQFGHKALQFFDLSFVLYCDVEIETVVAAPHGGTLTHCVD